MKRNHLYPGALLLALVLPTAAIAWTEIHRGADHNALVPLTATVTDLTATPTWVTEEEDLSPACRPILGDGVVYTIATAASPEETVRIKAFDQAGGSLLASSGPLDVGSFVSFESASTAAFDPATNTVFMASGSTVAALDGTTLDTLWSTEMGPGNTDGAPGAMYSFLNASPSVGDGAVFVKTYDSSFGVAGSQVVALDTEDGSIIWYARTGGRGTHAPLVLDSGIVITEYQSNGAEIGFAAWDASATGEATPLWTSSWTVETASGFHGLWGDMVTDGTNVYTVTSDFTDGRLVKFQAADGSLGYDLPVPASDIPPVLLSGSLYVLHSDGTLRQYDADDGTLLANEGIGGMLFRNYPAFMQDGFYVSLPGDGLTLLDLEGDVLSSNDTLSGAVTVDPASGAVYINAGNGRLARLDAPSSVGDWREFSW